MYIRMGFAFSKTVDLKMPRNTKGKSRSKHPCDCLPNRNSQNNHQSWPQTISATFMSASEPHNLCKFYQRRHKRSPHSSSSHQLNSLVLIAEKEGLESISSMEFPSNYRRHRREGIDLIPIELRRDFAAIEATLQKLKEEGDENRRMKLRKFVISWRAALTYRHAKMDIFDTGIPLTATSQCKKESKRWARYLNYFNCLSLAKTNDKMQDDQNRDELLALSLVIEKDSEAAITTTSFLIKHDVKRMRLYECVSYPEDEHLHKKSSKDEDIENMNLENEDDLDMTVAIRVNIPQHINLEVELEKPVPIPASDVLHKGSLQRIKRTISEINLSKAPHHHHQLHIRNKSIY